MNSRQVQGKKIVRVEQTRVTANHGETVWHVDAIVLEDGTKLVPGVAELEGDYAVTMTVYPPKPTRTKEKRVVVPPTMTNTREELEMIAIIMADKRAAAVRTMARAMHGDDDARLALKTLHYEWAKEWSTMLLEASELAVREGAVE